jgi:hypothetical protein
MVNRLLLLFFSILLPSRRNSGARNDGRLKIDRRIFHTHVRRQKDWRFGNMGTEHMRLGDNMFPNGVDMQKLIKNTPDRLLPLSRPGTDVSVQGVRIYRRELIRFVSLRREKKQTRTVPAVYLKCQKNFRWGYVQDTSSVLIELQHKQHNSTSSAFEGVFFGGSSWIRTELVNVVSTRPWRFFCRRLYKTAV